MVLSGQILQERYRLQRLLGNSRGSRQTWLAEDLAAEPAEPVAIKLLAFSPKLQWEELKLFEREASVLKHLEHPLIPQYRDYFSLDKEAGDGLPWFGLVQSYITGSSLQEQLSSGKRFSEEEAKAIAEEILEILIYLHELNPQVLHRDIKPSNIIQSEDNRVYLVDFGSVQERAKAEGATFTVVGTGGYAPPEQLWGRATSASDLYALGATLIHLLTGIFPSELPSRNMRLQFKDKVSLAPGFSAWLEKLVEPAAERRFPEARAALAALKAADSAIAKEGKNRAPGRGRIGTLALIQYAAIACFASIIPFFVVVLRKAPHARNNVGTMNRAQQGYHVDNMNFADSLPRLGIGIPNSTVNYEYLIRRDRGAVFHYAIPRFESLKAYVGGVFVVSSDSTDSHSSEIFTVAILCEAKHQGATPPHRPIARGNSIECAPDTKPLSDNLTQLGKDFELGNRSREEADLGQYEAAVKIATRIENDYLKASVLADIASAAIASGQEPRGQEIFDKAVKVAMQSKSDRDNALAAIARAMANAGLNEQALEMTSKLDRFSSRQNALLAIARSFAKPGDFDRALDIASILKRDAKQKNYDYYNFESSVKAAIARSLADADQFDRAKNITANLPKEYSDRIKQYIIVSQARAELEQGNMQEFYKIIDSLEVFKHLNSNAKKRNAAFLLLDQSHYQSHYYHIKKLIEDPHLASTLMAAAGRHLINRFNLLQQKYYSEKQLFADSLEELGFRDIKANKNQSYKFERYRIDLDSDNPAATFIYAISDPLGDYPSYVGATFAVADASASGETSRGKTGQGKKTVSIICKKIEKNRDRGWLSLATPSKDTRPAPPTLENGIPTCAANTIPIRTALPESFKF